MNADTAVRYERDGAVGVITLNRPDNRNSMTSDLLDAFAVASAAAARDAGARCVVITGSGSCFSAGADLRAQIQREGSSADKPRLPAERSYAMYVPFLSVLELEVPVVGALNGHAVGGGFGLALLCDVRIGAVGAKYGANFARLGLHPGLGVSYVLPRLVGVSNAAELLFTGRLIKGDEAARVGILSRALPAAEVLPAAMTLALEIASAAPAAVRMMKRSLYEGLGWDVRAAAWREAYAQAATVASDDAREGMQALLDKREPKFTGR